MKKTPKWWRVAWRVALIVVANVLALLFAGCRSLPAPEVVEVPRVQMKIEYRDRVLRDTVATTDSVFVREKGDTVRIERWRTRYVERFVLDTVAVVQNDTVTMVKRIYLEKEMSWWQRVKVTYGGYCLMLMLVLVGLLLWRLVQ